MSALVEKSVWIMSDAELLAELQRIRSKTPKTKDGFTILIGDEVFFYEEDSNEPMGLKVNAIYAANFNGVPAGIYQGDFIIGAEWFEAGNLSFYHHKENVPLCKTRDDPRQFDTKLP